MLFFGSEYHLKLEMESMRKGYNSEKVKRRKKTSNTKKNNKKMYIVIFLVLFLAFIVSTGILVKWFLASSKSKNINKDIMSKVINNVEVNSDFANPEQIQINFSELLKINEDVVGWIIIEGTSINYPIVKTNDNEYYLSHNILKNKSQNGWIFMDYRNNIDFFDKNTILFGHNIKSGIMFSDLKKIYDGAITPNIYIYKTKGGINKYMIYSTYMEKPDDYAINPQLDKINYTNFQKSRKNKSKNEYNVEINDNETLTLSTCDSTGKNRILVHAIKQ